MIRLRAVLTVLICVVAGSAAHRTSAASMPALSLEMAFAKALERHPDLRRTPLDRAVRRAEADQAGLKPALIGTATLENALGTGSASGFRGAEFSLSLGSVIERGGKREARISLAQQRIDALNADVETKRLDLLAEVARRYLDALAAQEIERASALAVEQRRSMVAAASRRVVAGASPRSAQLSAEAALARAKLDAARALEVARSARRRLAMLWDERELSFDSVSGNLLELPRFGTFDELAQLVERSPELKRFASEARVREARVQLARSASRADIDWQIGVRRMQSERDTALLGSVSIPFGSGKRSAPGIAAAEAELALLDLERESDLNRLYSTLAEAHGRLVADSIAVTALRDEVVPKLAKAESSAESTYRAGAISHLEWAQLQVDLLNARREQVESARDFHRALIEIQRLTGHAFLIEDGSSIGGLQP
jgi:cobalt-zinc-cadmium efflux system outer membrane protein